VGWRLWGLRLLLAVGVPCFLVLVMEGLLRIIGFGYPTHFFLHSQIDGKSVFIDNQDFGRRFFPSGLVRYPQPFTIEEKKKQGTVRIFVLGESAAMGDPDVKFGMPKMLEVLLRERYPQRRFEVVNTAMVAINSHAILPIARECASKQGDLWIVYMGNNEVIGSYGSASVFGARAPSLPLIRASVWLKTMRLGQLMDAGQTRLFRNKKTFTSWDGMQMMAGQKVSHDDPSTVRVSEHFERNLTDILRISTDAGVPVLLCTVATNLKDCAPFASLHARGLKETDLKAWQAAFDEGVAFQKAGKWTEAKACYEKAAKLDDEYAELAFRHATCCLRLGNINEASNEFRRARDLDALQFRTSTTINRIITNCAAKASDHLISFLDAEQLFATNSLQGIPGTENFYEHVHLTPEGNYLQARAMADQTAKALSLGPSGSWLSQSDCLSKMGLTDWNRYDAMGIIIDRIQNAPFVGQANHAEELQRLTEQRSRLRASTKPAQVQRELQAVSKLVLEHPEDVDLRWNLAVLLEMAYDQEGAVKQWIQLIQMRPQAAMPRINLARILQAQGKREDAYRFYMEGLQINPEYFPARHAMGMLCLDLGLVTEAIHHLKILVVAKPNFVDGRVSLAGALRKNGQVTEAIEQLHEAQKINPKDEMIAFLIKDYTESSRKQ